MMNSVVFVCQPRHHACPNKSRGQEDGIVLRTRYRRRVRIIRSWIQGLVLPFAPSSQVPSAQSRMNRLIVVETRSKHIDSLRSRSKRNSKRVSEVKDTRHFGNLNKRRGEGVNIIYRLFCWLVRIDKGRGRREGKMFSRLFFYLLRIRQSQRRHNLRYLDLQPKPEKH